jgi:hypothetical protein
MKKTASYYLMSALAGCVWAILVYLISLGAMGSIILGGLIASPFIGLLIGFLYKPVYKLPKAGQVFMSLLTLYLAATLFGLAMGLYDAYRHDIPNRILSGVIIQSVLATLWGLTFLGYFVLLWPLSYFTHQLLGRRQKAV